MPIVTVTAPALPPDRERQALVALTAAIATALELPPDGVFATTVATRAGVLGEVDAQWPLVILHGGRRPAALMSAAATAASASVAASWDAAEVWVQWAVRE